jgi:hypothetical protein|tara:strand:- start:1011 stop:1295 length:285 start_codon:yes stop_codon:yes gene_type:complete
MFAVTAPRGVAVPVGRAASLASKRRIVAAPLRVTQARRASSVDVTARAAGTIRKVTKDELEEVMKVRPHTVSPGGGGGRFTRPVEKRPRKRRDG